MTLPEIEKASSSIRPYISGTPLLLSNFLSRTFGAEVWLKCENLQKTGSFKVRGSFNKILRSGAAKVTAASMGNHAQGVAYAAATLGVKARIIMPETVSAVKEEATRHYGAEVVLHGKTLSEAVDFAKRQRGYAFIHPFDDEDVIAGQGTAGLEIAHELERPDAVLVPVGGGGLISGIAVAVKGLSPKTKIIGVQSDAALSALESFRAGRIVKRKPSASYALADGILVGCVGNKTFRIMREHVDAMASVPDDSIADAVFLLMERKKLVAEGAGAAPLSFLMREPKRFRGKRIVLVVSGGNIDFSLVDRVVRRALISGGRVNSFRVVIDDLPGSLNRLTGIIARNRANILNVVHERNPQGYPLHKTAVEFTIETKNRKHFEIILADIKKEGVLQC